MPSKRELARWAKNAAEMKSEHHSPPTFQEWRENRHKTEPRNSIVKSSDKSSPDDAGIDEYIQIKIGIEPNASGSKRRWHFLGIMAKQVCQQKSIGSNDFFKWTTANCQCMKMRTLREDYLDTLERLGLIRFDQNTGKIEWKAENSV